LTRDVMIFLSMEPAVDGPDESDPEPQAETPSTA